ncbi:MAG: VWA domain-containing protein [Pseudomonadales bacterium]|nr:VWA domain-containing protein [Pseudomonadales bacterium]
MKGRDKKSVTKKDSDLTVSSKNDVQQFLSKVAAMPKTAGDARLIFALDATASREASWDVASQLQTEMFLSTQSLGGLNIQLCYFRGFGEFFNSDWQNNADEIVQTMSRINCQAGATQIERVLRHAITENEHNKIKCVVYIGDAMEENIDILAQLAGKFGLLNIPIFMFQERGDPLARKAFMELSRLSGGAYSQFDQASAEHLKELLKAVAIFAAGGLKALQDFSKSSSKEVRLLEQQLKS